MPMLFIKCPATGKPVATGIDVPPDALDRPDIVLRQNGVGCPHCPKGTVHVWDKEGAFFLPQQST